MSEENKKWQPTPELRGIILGLLEEESKEKSRTIFVNKYLPIGLSLWSQIADVVDDAKKVSYFDKVSEARRESLIEELRNMLDEIPLQRAAAARIAETSLMVTSKIRALAASVRECKAKSGPERLTKFLAPTGGGKTMGCNYLQREMKARLVQVNESWRHCPNEYIPLCDVCRAAGMSVEKIRNPAFVIEEINRLKKAFIRFAAERNILLCFDEGEHFGRSALNLLKYLLNETRIVPSIFAVTSEHDKWVTWFPNEAGQIARRTHAIIEISTVETKDVDLFFPDNQFHKREDALRMICNQASEFGHYSLVHRIAAKLEGVTRADADDVDKAIYRARLQMERNVPKPKAMAKEVEA